MVNLVLWLDSAGSLLGKKFGDVAKIEFGALDSALGPSVFFSSIVLTQKSFVGTKIDFLLSLFCLISLSALSYLNIC